jgi:hypothetical protein
VGTVEIALSGAANMGVGIGALLLASALLTLARTMPLALAPIIAVLYGATALAGFDPSPVGTWIPLLAFACFAAGLHAEGTRILAGLACVLLALGITLGGLAWLTSFAPNPFFGLIITLGAFGLGHI